MKQRLFLLLLCPCLGSFAQGYIERIEAYQVEQFKSFKDPDNSPLTPEDLEDFERLEFFPIRELYCVKAQFVKKKGEKFEMPTSTDRKPIYQSVGLLQFELNGEKLELTVYKNIALSKNKEYENYLFVPFKDLTCGVESYGGGRYLDLQEPQNDEPWVLDFNLSYNPYCAYNHTYSCPIPPVENHLKVRIEAGAKAYRP